MIPGSINALLLGEEAGGAAAYSISRSLRFNSSDSAYLSRTPASSGSLTRWTWAGWVKKSGQGLTQGVFGVEVGAIQHRFGFKSDEKFEYLVYNGSFPLLANKVTTQVFRDPSAWFHLVVVWDSANSTASDRMQIYVNGQRITTFDASTDPTSSLSGYVNSSSYQHYISNGFSGYLADIHFIDGQALTPSSFTEVSATTGQLIPKAYTGSFGTNGFWLKFSDNSAATATTLGKDYSGSNNNWTPNNLSVTAGAGNDSLTDTPTSGGTDTGLGGQVTGNYATLNPLAGKGTLSNGNLDFVTAAAGDNVRHATIGVGSGKWYFETTITSAVGDFTGVGLYGANVLGQVNPTPSRGYGSSGIKYSNGSNTSYGATFGNGDIIGCAFDVDSGKIWFSKNGTWQASGDPVAGTNATYTDLAGITWVPTIQGGNSMGAVAVNFGQRQWAYTAPSGFRPLVDTLLPSPVVAKPDQFFQTVLWTGDNSNSRTISGLNFSPDLVWKKRRTANGDSHYFVDSVRGDNSGVMRTLFSNQTVSEQTTSSDQELQYGYISALTSSGFTVSAGSNASIPRAAVNDSSYAYVAWAFDAGSNTVSNTAGSITSQVRANPSAGFSIVTFTCPSSGAYSFGHGLSVAPSMVIMKDRGGSTNWIVYHSAVTSSSEYLILNGTNAKLTASGIWGAGITTTVVGSTANVGINPSNNAVAYCFAPVAGYSSFGSYVGTGAVSTGPFCYTGFRPRLVILKAAVGGTSGWIMVDTARNTYNAVDYFLQANSSGAESTQVILDAVSNGFVIRPVGDAMNNSGVTFVWAAFAESPFQYARAR